MKDVILQRIMTSDEGTFGKIVYDDIQWITGELPKYGGNPDIPNERSVDYIPAGEYEVIWSYSNKFKTHLYELLNVPNRSGVRIHTGNHCGNVNKGYKSDVEGCIILGSKLGKLNGQNAVINSKAAFSRFCEIIGTNKFKLLITESF